jgi:hypothetical protein
MIEPSRCMRGRDIKGRSAVVDINLEEGRDNSHAHRDAQRGPSEVSARSRLQMRVFIVLCVPRSSHIPLCSGPLTSPARTQDAARRHHHAAHRSSDPLRSCTQRPRATSSPASRTPCGPGSQANRAPICRCSPPYRAVPGNTGAVRTSRGRCSWQSVAHR